MIKFFATIFFFLSIINPLNVHAGETDFVTVVNPVRGLDFWEDKNQKPKTVVFGQMEILEKFGINATYLLRHDALYETEITDKLRISKGFEKGIFLEITPIFAKDSDVSYHKSKNWHSAGSAFLSGYEREERIKFIDTAFEKFKEIFGYYPKSVGAWWIDAFSLSYMQEKFGIEAALIVSDQYTTDNYQIWGQFWSTPYFPSIKNILHPAQNPKNKLPVVITQWAIRDPINGYGKGVEESTFSVQANDYLDYHNLDSNYFAALVDIYTKQKFNQFGHLTVGLENSYSWGKYSGEYQKQIEILDQKSKQGQFSTVTMEDFASWYKNKFPDLSPPHIIVADDPLGSFKEAVWFMNQYYRAGWFYNEQGSVIRDIRQYIEGEEELCFTKGCDEVNFGTSATRVLDEVSFGHKYTLDEGKIFDFKVEKREEKYVLTYKNAADNVRAIEFLPRDIGVDGKISSIDTLILDQTIKSRELIKVYEIKKGFFEWSPVSAIFDTFKFLFFLVVSCLAPGYLFVSKILGKTSFLKKLTVSLISGQVIFCLIFYFLGLFNLRILIFGYFAINFLVFIKIYKDFKKELSSGIKSIDFSVLGLIFIGTIFQQLPTFQNGLIFPYGMGFWGPNTHDGMWHIALINQLVKSIPPQNPIFSGEVLKNYHYFYDLLIASTNYILGISILDLLFRFYPVTFSIILGAATYCFIKYFLGVTKKLPTLISIYLVYFAGSFGWIVEYLKQGRFGGESAFWANQPISFNLNPPFAISLLIVIAIFLLLSHLKSKLAVFLISILAGSLIVFKAYAAILILISFIIVGILKKNLNYILTFLLSFLLSVTLFLLNSSISQKLFIFSPFWFIHSMIDSPDRVGWVRLSLTRTMGLETGNWFKFLAAETLSFLIFLFGNLGTRVFALPTLFNIGNIVRRVDYLFIFVFSTLSFIIPILFIQAGNPWNTIQFLYYFLYVSAVIGGIVFVKIISKFKEWLAILIVAVFVLVTPINSFSTASSYLSYQPHALITKEELDALKFLKSQEEGIVLTYPYDSNLKNNLVEPWPILIYDSTAYVSAMSGKEVFVEDEAQNQILLTDYKKRLVSAEDFFTNPYSSGSKFLNENDIEYIYLTKIYKKTLDEQKLNLKVIFQNQEVYIYKVN